MSIAESVLSDPSNDLAAIAAAFLGSGDACWHVDRHVLEILEGEGPDASVRQDACAAAVSLARIWNVHRTALGGSALRVSRPFVVIDDAWIAGAPNAQPPHVYVCLALDDLSLQPVVHCDVTSRASSGHAMVDSQVGAQERLLRADGAYEGEPGAWILELDD